MDELKGFLKGVVFVHLLLAMREGTFATNSKGGVIRTPEAEQAYKEAQELLRSLGG